MKKNILYAAIALSLTSLSAQAYTFTVSGATTNMGVGYGPIVNNNGYYDSMTGLTVYEGVDITIGFNSTLTSFFDYDIYYTPKRQLGTETEALAKLVKVGTLSQASPTFTFNESSMPGKILGGDINASQGRLHFVPKTAEFKEQKDYRTVFNFSANIVNQSAFDADAQSNRTIPATLDIYPQRVNNINGVFKVGSIDPTKFEYKIVNNTSIYQIILDKAMINDAGVYNIGTPAGNSLEIQTDSTTWFRSAKCTAKIYEPGEVNGNGKLGTNWGGISAAYDTSKTQYPFDLHLFCPDSSDPNKWFVGGTQTTPTQIVSAVYNRLGPADLQSKVKLTPSATTMRRFADSVTIEASDVSASYCPSGVSLDANLAGTEGACKVTYETPEGVNLVNTGSNLVMTANTAGTKVIKPFLHQYLGGKWYFSSDLTPVSITVNDIATPSLDPTSAASMVVKKGQRLTTNELRMIAEANANVKLSLANAAGKTLLSDQAETLSLNTSSTGDVLQKLSTLTDSQALSTDTRNVGDTLPLTVKLKYAYDALDEKAHTQVLNVKVMPASDMQVSNGQTSPTVYTDGPSTFTYKLQLVDQPALPFSEGAFGAGWTGSVKVRQVGSSTWTTNAGVVGTYANGQLSVTVDGTTLLSGQSYELLVEFTNPTLNNVVISTQQTFSVIQNTSVTGTLSLSNTSLIAGTPVVANLALSDMTDLGLANVASVTFKYRKQGDAVWINAAANEITNNGLTMTKQMTTGGIYEFMVTTKSKSNMTWDSEVKTLSVSASATLDLALSNPNIQLFKAEEAKLSIEVSDRELRSMSDAVLLAKSARDGAWMIVDDGGSSTVNEFTAALGIQSQFAVANTATNYGNSTLSLVSQSTSSATQNDSVSLTFLAIDKSVFAYWSTEIAAGRATIENAAAAISQLISRGKIAPARITWNAAKMPRLSVAGLDTTTEAGVTQTLLLTASHAISKYSGSYNKIKGFFVGSDGQNIPINFVNGAAQISWTPNIDTIDPANIAPESRIHVWYENDTGNKVKNPVANKLASWSDDFVRTYRMATFKYQFPQYVLNVSTDYQFAPAKFNVKIASSVPVSQYQLRKFPMTYTWSVANNDATAVDSVTFRASKERFSGEFLKAGTYTVTLNYMDGKGNTGVATQVLEILEPIAMEITFKDSFSNKYMRAPLSASVTALISGGHKKERIANAKWYIDDVLVKDVSKGSLTRHLFTDLAAGNKTVKVEFTTTLGRTFSGTKSYTVNENQLPVCQSIVKQEYAFYDRYTANCTDVDGKIKLHKWVVNGESVSPTSNRITVPRATVVNSISVQAVDDAGAESTPVN